MVVYLFIYLLIIIIFFIFYISETDQFSSIVSVL